MTRLFIALTLDDDLIKAMEEPLSRLRTYKSILKPVEPGSLHITLKFLGECDDAMSEQVMASFRSFKPEVLPGPVCARGLGAFPRITAPSVIWCGLEGCPEVAILQQGIERLSVSLGFTPEDRPFNPHLTLARVRRESAVPRELLEYLESNRGTLYCTSRFKKLALFKSLLTKTGPLYTELHEIPLGH